MTYFRVDVVMRDATAEERERGVIVVGEIESPVTLRQGDSVYVVSRYPAAEAEELPGSPPDLL